MNIEAPIIPRESVAGIQLGSSIEEVLREQNHHFISEEVVNPFVPVPTVTHYRSAIVDLWVVNLSLIHI